MKVNIITFHFAHNFGAVMQCYALQEKVKELGYDVEVVNYRPEYHTKRYACLISPFRYYQDAVSRMEKNGNLTMRKQMILLVKAALVNRKAVGNIIREKNFERFVKEHLQQGIRCTTQQDLTELYGGKKEFFIAGSDQIWNRESIGGDTAYFLQFAAMESTRIAYAASFGDEEVSCMAEMARLINSFNAVSIREEANAAKLRRSLNRDVAHVLDPAFLLPESAYRSCEKEVRRIGCKRYILVYDLSNTGQLELTLKRILQENSGLWAVNLSRFRLKGVPGNRVLNLQSIGPGEILTCIKNAVCILTDSFHGMTFSIIYHKNFWAFENKNGSLRLKELLCRLKMENRMIPMNGQMAEDWKQEIDYFAADMLLARNIAESISFLEMALGVKGDGI